MTPDDSPPPHQFALLRQRRFAPFFFTQFLGAMNDNVLKFAFTVLVTYQLSVSWMPAQLAGLVIGAVFVLPFLLFSATAGQVADAMDKAWLMRWVKNLEVGIMLLAAWGLWDQQVALLLACIFLMGLHSTFFGPVKYAYLPQHLDMRELTGGNGLVEMGTFVAILLGNVFGGVLIALPDDALLRGTHAVALFCLVVAAAGRVAVQGVPASPAAHAAVGADGPLKIRWNPFTETWRNLRLAHQSLTVFRSLLGISWLWFFGAVFLSQFPAFAKEILHGDEHVASLLLVIFSVGVGVGSLLCEVLGRRHVEIGLVPLGALGMSVFAADLWWASAHLGTPAALQTLGMFISAPSHWRVMVDLFLMSLSAGLFSVPMYVLVQMRSPATHRARIVAANNILNALFMIASSLIVGTLLSSGWRIPQVFGLLALANAVVAAWICWVVPEYLLRFIAWVMARCIYRLHVLGDRHIPTEGAAVIVCNHVSFIDAVLLMAVSPRPIRFLMDHRIFRIPVLGWIFRLAKAIPVAPQHESPAVYEVAFAEARQVLADGELLGLFPEGGITMDGQLQPFKWGVMKILGDSPVPVLPVALQNLWGSFFSRVEHGSAMVRPFRRGVFNRVGVVIAPPMAPSDVSPERLHAEVTRLLDGPRA